MRWALEEHQQAPAATAGEDDDLAPAAPVGPAPDPWGEVPDRLRRG